MKVKLKELNSGYEGYSVVSRFSKKTKSKMIIAGVLAGLFLFVFVLSSVGIIPFDALGARASNLVFNSEDNFPININTDSTLGIKIIGDSFLVLSTNDVTVYSSKGKAVFSEPHNFSSPTVSVNGNKAVVFDRGDTGFMLITEKKLVFSGDAVDDIICAEYGESGNYALGTLADKSTSMLTVYTPTNKVDFQWNCAYEHITSIALSPNGKFAGVSILGVENGEIVSLVKYFGFDYSEELNSQKIKGSSAFEIEFTQTNMLTLFTNTGVYSISKKREKYEPVTEFYSAEFNSYDIANDGKYVVSIAKYGSADDFLITVYSGSGKEKVQITADYKIKNVTMSDKYVFALAENSLIVYNLSGKVVSEILLDGEAYGVCASDGYAYISSLNKISRCYSYGDQTVDLTF